MFQNNINGSKYFRLLHIIPFCKLEKVNQKQLSGFIKIKEYPTTRLIDHNV